MVIIARSRKDNRCWTSCGRGGLSLLLGESFWPILRRRGVRSCRVSAFESRRCGFVADLILRRWVWDARKDARHSPTTKRTTEGCETKEVEPELATTTTAEEAVDVFSEDCQSPLIRCMSKPQSNGNRPPLLSNITRREALERSELEHADRLLRKQPSNPMQPAHHAFFIKRAGQSKSGRSHKV